MARHAMWQGTYEAAVAKGVSHGHHMCCRGWICARLRIDRAHGERTRSQNCGRSEGVWAGPFARCDRRPTRAADSSRNLSILRESEVKYEYPDYRGGMRMTDRQTVLVWDTNPFEPDAAL